MMHNSRLTKFEELKDALRTTKGSVVEYCTAKYLDGESGKFFLKKYEISTFGSV